MTTPAVRIFQQPRHYINYAGVAIRETGAFGVRRSDRSSANSPPIASRSAASLFQGRRIHGWALLTTIVATYTGVEC